MSRVSVIWRKGDLDIIRKVFVQVIKSNHYNDYLNSDKDGLTKDKKFIQLLLENEFILDNDIFHHILQERKYILVR